MLESRLSDKINQLSELNHDLLNEEMEQLKKKDKDNQFNVMINSLGTQDLIGENPRGFRNEMDTSRHNLSEEQI